MSIGKYDIYSKTIQNADWTILYYKEKPVFIFSLGMIASIGA
jgi:hypothetical protein